MVERGQIPIVARSIAECLFGAMICFGILTTTARHRHTVRRRTRLRCFTTRSAYTQVVPRGSLIEGLGEGRGNSACADGGEKDHEHGGGNVRRAEASTRWANGRRSLAF
jgi:hypothetical protein